MSNCHTFEDSASFLANSDGYFDSVKFGRLVNYSGILDEIEIVLNKYGLHVQPLDVNDDLDLEE